MVMCLAQMNAILDVDPRNLTLRAQPGVTTITIDEAAARHGLFYPPDPGSMRISTIGGNVAENSGGLRGLKYGVTRDYVMAIEVVLADGRITRFGSPCVKDVAGYSMKDLFVGSEGTLGIITEVLLKLVPRPAARRTMLALYDRIEDAAETVSAIIAARIIPCTLEFLDRMTAGCVEDYAHVGLPTDCDAVLLMETDGHPAAVADESERMADIARQHGAREVRAARTRRKGWRWPPRDGMRSPRWRVAGRRRSSRMSPCRGRELADDGGVHRARRRASTGSRSGRSGTWATGTCIRRFSPTSGTPRRCSACTMRSTRSSRRRWRSAARSPANTASVWRRRRGCASRWARAATS